MESRLKNIEDIVDKLAQNAIVLDQKMTELIASQTKTDAQLAKTDEQMAKRDAQFAETDKQVKLTSRIISGIGINLGNASEQLFYESLKKNMTIGEIKFDTIVENVSVKKKKHQAELDILMYNGEYVAIIETKHNVQKSDIDELTTKKVESYRKLFPKYADYNLILGMAGTSFSKDMQDYASVKGVAVLLHRGETFVVNARNIKEF